MQKKKTFLVIALGVICLFAGKTFAADKLPVFVSIIPQKYFVQQIGKDMVDVQVMVQPGASPATYEPKPKQMVDLAKAKIYFSIGVPFESAWLDKIAAAGTDLKIVHTDQGINKRPMAAHLHHGKGHSDGHHDADNNQNKGTHKKVGLDPHIWMSPSLVKIQAKNILTALQAIDPAHSDAYTANYNTFIKEIDTLSADLKKTLAGKKDLEFMVFHPAWGYFADEFGLYQIPIEIEGKEPKPEQLKALIHHAQEHGIKVIFVQPQFSVKSAELIAKEIGGQVVFANPLAEDWMKNMRQTASKFKDALR